jgi:sulfhydrogenase subunit beta (sulfur reductase)
MDEEELYSLFHRLLARQPVMAPRERVDQPGFYKFDWLERVEQLVLDSVITTIPPKKAFFPTVETLFTFTPGSPPELVTAGYEEPFVLAGVNPCDLSAITALDLAYAHPPAEVRWSEHRKRATIIGLDCLPDEYCFCTSVQTSNAREPCDLFLTEIGRGYLVEVYTPEGEELLSEVSTLEATEQDLADAEQWRQLKAERTSASFTATMAEFADILEAGGLTEVWKDVASRCYSCGSCNTTCPTCFCFDMRDDFDLTLSSGMRRRVWDSCQLLDFALVAGGHNFRGDRWQRVRHRWQRKFLYLYRQFGRPYCTGCGRCSRACTADINIVDVSNQLIAYSQEELLDG